METDEMELDTIGDRKTALFVIISDTDDTFNFVVSILYPYRLHDTRPHFPAQYTAAGAAPLTTEYRRAAGLTQRGDSRLYQRAVFLCGGDHTLTAFCPLAGQPQTRQKGYIYGIFQ